MNLLVRRFIETDVCTLGTMDINGAGACFTLEDVSRKVKVPSETCIPAGTYDIELRNEGGMNGKYTTKFGAFHKGMLWLKDVPDFEWIYIHYGNYAKNTEGCILVGNSADISNDMVGSSIDAYKRIYARISSAIELGQRVTIKVI